MQRTLTIILLLLGLTAFGQKGMWKPFKLVVVAPDTAVIDKSLYSGRDSVQAEYLRSYYASLDQMEKLLNFKDSSRANEPSYKERKEELAKGIQQMKGLEEKVKKFKYFQLISFYSTQVYSFYFNEYEPFSTIVELPSQKTDPASLKMLADTAGADYVIFFSNLHTVEQDGMLVLKLTTSLYARKEGKVILTTETDGDVISRGEMWTCRSDVPLSCLLINGVRTSTNEVADVLRKRQIRQQ